MSRDGRAAVPAGPPFRFLPQALLEPRRPLLAIAVGWAAAFFPSLLLSLMVRTALPQVGQPDFTIVSPYELALVIVFAPVVETLVMAAVLALLLTFLKPGHAVLASAVGWGLAHSAIAPAWGLVIWWPFLVFSTLFVTWRKRSLLLALAIPAAVHGLQNSLPALLLFYRVGA